MEEEVNRLEYGLKWKNSNDDHHLRLNSVDENKIYDEKVRNEND